MASFTRHARFAAFLQSLSDSGITSDGSCTELELAGELVRYLALRSAHPEEALSPSPLVSDAWGVLLHTPSLYYCACAQVCPPQTPAGEGVLIDPGDDLVSHDAAALYARALGLYERRFVFVPEHVWPSSPHGGDASASAAGSVADGSAVDDAGVGAAEPPPLFTPIPEPIVPLGSSPERSLQIFFRGYNESGGLRTLTLRVSRFDTVATLKIMIKNKGGTLAGAYLQYGGKLLEDKKTLDDYNIQDESTLM